MSATFAIRQLFFIPADDDGVMSDTPKIKEICTAMRDAGFSFDLGEAGWNVGADSRGFELTCDVVLRWTRNPKEQAWNPVLVKKVSDFAKKHRLSVALMSPTHSLMFRQPRLVAVRKDRITLRTQLWRLENRVDQKVAKADPSLEAVLQRGLATRAEMVRLLKVQLDLLRQRVLEEKREEFDQNALNLLGDFDNLDQSGRRRAFILLRRFLNGPGLRHLNWPDNLL